MIANSESASSDNASVCGIRQTNPLCRKIAIDIKSCLSSSSSGILRRKTGKSAREEARTRAALSPRRMRAKEKERRSHEFRCRSIADVNSALSVFSPSMLGHRVRITNARAWFFNGEDDGRANSALHASGIRQSYTKERASCTSSTVSATLGNSLFAMHVACCAE